MQPQSVLDSDPDTGPRPASHAAIRVALVEDDVQVLRAVTAFIATADDMQLAYTASTRAEGLRMLEQPPADVLLVDLGLPDGSGIDVIRAARARWERCGVMVCTAFGDELHVMDALEAGASGYLLKDSAPANVVQEIRSLHAGGSPISPLIARQILSRFRGAGAAGTAPAASATVAAPETPGAAFVERRTKDALSGREKEVLELFTKGFTAEEIAGLLKVSPHTVLTYVRRIYGKLKVSSRAEAIYEARQRGILGA